MRGQWSLTDDGQRPIHRPSALQVTEGHSVSVPDRATGEGLTCSTLEILQIPCNMINVNNLPNEMESYLNMLLVMPEL